MTLRPLERRDFALLASWLAEPLVARWWNHDYTSAAVERDFGPAVDGREPTDLFIAEAERRAFGLIQCYRIEDYEEYLEELSPVLPIPPGALSIDYLIGEPAFRGRRLGTRMITTFLELAWSRYPDADDVIVPVSAGNHASWRTLEGAGFGRVSEGHLQPDNPRDSRDHFVYHLRRPETTART